MLRAGSTMARAAHEIASRGHALLALGLAFVGCSAGSANPGPHPPMAARPRSRDEAPSEPAQSATSSGKSAPSATGSAAAAPAPASTLALALPEGRDTTSERVPEEADLVRGRSTVRVDAPLAAVRAKVLDFNHYTEFMPFYRGARVLDRTAERTKVFMQVAALGGLVKMDAQMWFTNAGAVVDGWEEHASTFESGNVVVFKAIWRLRKIDDDHTWLSLEIFLLPKLPLPTELLNDENILGAQRGVNAMRARVEAP